MIRNRFFLPYSYFILILKENNRGKPLTENNFDSQAIYQYKGETVLHRVANRYQTLEFILQQYKEKNPKLVDMLLLRNNDGFNVLQLALKYENQRSVNLILKNLSGLSMNNIHALKENFTQLLDYNGFENYL